MNLYEIMVLSERRLAVTAQTPAHAVGVAYLKINKPCDVIDRLIKSQDLRVYLVMGEIESSFQAVDAVEERDFIPFEELSHWADTVEIPVIN